MEGINVQDVLSRLGEMLNGSGFDLVAIVSAGVALIGAIFSWRETRKQRRLALEKMRRELDERSVSWGCEAIEALADCEMVLRHGYSDAMGCSPELKRHELMTKLSALADQGRFYFPNIDDDNQGADKEAAYQGKRPPILDALVYGYYQIESVSALPSDAGADAADFVKSCRRLLVSELQAHLDPKTRNAVVERFNHRIEDQREDAIYRAGKLGLELNLRHAGLLTHKNDSGWTFFAQNRDLHKT